MKNIVILLVFVLFSLVVFSQDKNKELNPLSLSLSSGQGAISSGLRLNANFANNKDLLTVSIGEQDIYFVYMKNIYKNIYSGPSIEYYHNIPTLGLLSSIGIYGQNDIKIAMTNWFAFSAGKPGERADFSDWQMLFFFHSLDLSYKRLSFCGAALWYEEWGYLFELKYTQPLSNKFSAFTSAGYNFYKDGNYIFSMGINYVF